VEITAPHVRLLLQAKPGGEGWSTGSRGVRFAVIGAGNILLCSYYERFLQDDTRAGALLTLLFLESVLLAVWVVRHFLSAIAPVLYRASLFGTSSSSRFWFAFLGTTSHPLLLTLWGSTVLAITVLCTSSPESVLLAVCITLALGVNVVAVILVVLLLANRSPDAVGLLLLTGGGLLVVAALASLLTWSSGIIATILPLAWSAEGLRAAQLGDLPKAVQSLLLLIPFPAAAVLLGRRYG
jgi:hypothetical protein